MTTSPTADTAGASPGLVTSGALVLLATVAGFLVWWALPEPALNDWPPIHEAGASLLRGHLDVFEQDPRLNVGPLGVLATGALGSQGLAAAVGGGLLAIALLALAPARTALVAGLLAAATLPWTTAAAYGHLDDQLAVCLLLLAVAFGTSNASGVSIGLATLAKPWAGLAFGLPPTARILWGVAAVGVGLLPFALAGSLSGAGRFMVAVQDGSTLELFRVSELPTWWRAVQLGVMVLAVFLLRHRPLLAVTAGVAVRLLLDPGDFPYYAAALAGVGAAAVLCERTWIPLLAAWVLFLSAGMGPAEATVRSVALLLVLFACVKGGRQSRAAGAGSQASAS